MNKTKLRQCLNCGAIFKPIKNNQKYCSQVCVGIVRERKQNAYYRMYDGCVDEYTSCDIYIKENERKSKPSINDIEDVLALLNGFGIKPKEIPKFNSYASLDHWKKIKIAEALS